jgi:hypothetical protein
VAANTCGLRRASGPRRIPVNICADDWVRALGEMEEVAGATGMTAEEIMEKTGRGSVFVHTQLRRLNRLGRLIVGHRPSTDLRGHRVKQVVYSIAPIAREVKE